MENQNRLTPFARKLRKEQTPQEALLWYRFLRTYKPRFHRQYIIGNYIVDFYCHRARLIIELDGSQHYEPDGLLKDAIRTGKIEARNLTVVRIPNNAVMQNFAGVCEYIDILVQQAITEH